MKLCMYSTIKFIPDYTTREFVTVGVLAYLPQTGEIDFRLAPARFERVTAFWGATHDETYSNAIAMMQCELERVKSHATIECMHGKRLVDFMKEQLAPGEGFMVFGESSAMLTFDALQTTLDNMFDEFVLRYAKNTCTR